MRKWVRKICGAVGNLVYFVLMLVVLYVLKLPEDLVVQVNDYAMRCDPEKKARILELAEQIKRRRAKEREQLLAQ